MSLHAKKTYYKLIVTIQNIFDQKYDMISKKANIQNI